MVGGGPSAVVLSELQLVGLVLVGLGALRQVVTLRPLLGVLADHLAERISVKKLDKIRSMIITSSQMAVS